MKEVEARLRWRFRQLRVVGTAVASLVPTDALLRVIAVGSGLLRGARTVFIVPTEEAHEVAA